MIPKIIHYCWFGGNPLPPLAIKCIESWKKFLPDYEIKEWNESNFDVNMIPYTAEAYRLKKYAFVSDYARFYVLFKYGGLYFDTDVEVIKNMDDIIARGPFMGFEANKNDTQTDLCIMENNKAIKERHHVAPGLGLGVNPGLGLYKEIIETYNKKHYTTWTGNVEDTVVTLVSRLLSKYEMRDMSDGIYQCKDIFIYAPEYFCPKNYYSGELKLTEKTVCIHHYTATWVKNNNAILSKVKKRLMFVWARFQCTFL